MYQKEAILYPLKFTPIFKDKIWGGSKIQTLLKKDFSPLPNCGETWEISGVDGTISIVNNGELAGRSLVSLIQEFKTDMVGEKVYKDFGDEFPLLIKFIDANDDLSIQVHPDDTLAKERHNSFGKTEMWYILQADEGAVLNSGFKTSIDEQTYLKHLSDNTLNEILNFEQVHAGDIFFLPAGRVHYIGKGVCLAEIQQTSDITYRIYDFDRKDSAGNKRELHTQEALAAIDYKHYDDYKLTYEALDNNLTSLVKCQYFSTSVLSFDTMIHRDFSRYDSFVIFICVEGEFSMNYTTGSIAIKMGDTILIPAALKLVTLLPNEKSKILEVYIP